MSAQPLRLFGRAWTVTVDTLDISNLDISFHISRTIKPEPNKLDLKVYNLSLDHVAQLTKRAKAKADLQGGRLEGLRVQVSAGYAGGEVPLLFRGDVRDIRTSQEGPDRVTEIAGGDGSRAYRTARINTSFGPGTSVQTVIQACANAMGIGIGNLGDMTAGVQIENLGVAYPSGKALSGKASEILTRLLNSAGLTYSIQSNTLQVQKKGVPLQSAAIRISADSGMIGAPTVEIDASVSQPSPNTPTTGKVATKKPHHLVAVKTLLIPGLVPGRIVYLDSADFHANYHIVQADYTGDTAGNDWNADLKLKAMS